MIPRIDATQVADGLLLEEAKVWPEGMEGPMGPRVKK